MTSPGAPAITCPGARRPDASRFLDAHGVELAVYEWGDPSARPLFFLHGGLDFAATFDLLAPLVADEGWRVVSWDQRGHGDSQRAALYSWESDIRDAYAVINSVSDQPAPILGHSKGGNLAMQLAEALPHRVSHVINLDGLPSKRPAPDVTNHDRSRLLATDLQDGSTTGARRPPPRRAGTLEELAERRGRLNPRLPKEWLLYIASIGARHDEDGWRWKLDPSMRFGGFGPWRPEWSLYRMASLGMPLLGLLGLEFEEMGWGTRPEDVRLWLPRQGRLVTLANVGHFVHIEEPALVADLVLDFLR
jgi:pimeloyl-ACP methyl ester carboxylesterase